MPRNRNNQNRNQNQPQYNYTVVNNESGLRYKTKGLDQREEEKLVLANGMRVLLTSDPGAEKSAAGLAVGVGDLFDPEDTPGLAHLVEHMVMHEENNKFMETVRKYFGEYEGITSDLWTRFVFDITHEGFDIALTQFSEFVKAPAFDPSHLANEINVVDQEAESAKYSHYIPYLVKADSPLSKFTCGNKETLKKVTAQQVKKWYEDHYNANNMVLTIITNKPIAQIREKVIALFDSVENRNNELKLVAEPALDPEHCDTILYLKQKREGFFLKLLWELPDATTLWTKRLKLLEVYLTTARGSLLQQLRDANLVSDLAVSSTTSVKGHNFINIDFTLIEANLSQWESILHMTFATFAKVRRDGIPEFIFNETTVLQQLEYMYRKRPDAFNEVAGQCTSLVHSKEGFATFPRLALFGNGFRPEAVKDLAAVLTPDQCRYIFHTPESRNIDDSLVYTLDSYTTIRHARVAISPALKRNLMQIQPSLITPLPNPYLPGRSDLTIVHPQRPITLDVLRTVNLGDFATMLFIPDSEFLVPKVNISLRIYSNILQQVLSDNHIYALYHLYHFALPLRLAEIFTLGGEGGNGAAITLQPPFMVINVNGYYSADIRTGLKFFIDHLLQNLKQDNLGEDRFNLYKTEIIKKLEAPQVASAEDLTTRWLDKIFSRKVLHRKEYLEAFKKITYADYQRFHESLFTDFYIKGVVGGNVTEQEAGALLSDIRNYFGVPNSKFNATNVRQQSTAAPVQPLALSKADKHKFKTNVVSLVFDAELTKENEDSLRNRVAVKVLHSLLDRKFSKAFRSIGLSYDVSCDFIEKGEPKRTVLQFYVETTLEAPPILLERVESVIKKLLSQLVQNKNRADFNTARVALLSQLTAPWQNFPEVMQHFSNLFFAGQGLDYSKRRIETVKGFTFEDFRDYCRQVLNVKLNQHRLAIMLNATPPDPEQLPEAKVRDYTVFGSVKPLCSSGLFRAPVPAAVAAPAAAAVVKGEKEEAQKVGKEEKTEGKRGRAESERGVEIGGEVEEKGDVARPKRRRVPPQRLGFNS